MTSTPLPGVAQTGRERRRFPRYDIEVRAIIRRKGGDLQVVTGDVSRHGAFLKSEQPAPVRQLVQVRFRLPEGELDAMCMVARWLGPETARGPGLGVDFFALSKDAKALWERFVADLRTRDAAIDASGFASLSTGSMAPMPGAPHSGVALPPSIGVPLPPSTSGVPLWMTPTSITGEVKARAPAPVDGPPPQSALAAQTWLPQASTPLDEVAHAQSSSAGAVTQVSRQGAVRPPPPPNDDDLPSVSGQEESSVVILRLSDRDQLRGFVANEVERGGMFLRTPLIKDVGEKVQITLVHPESDEEFRLDGTVVRRLVTGPKEARGLGIFFRALTKEQSAQLLEFIESGIEVVELGTPITQRQIDLEAAVAKEPDSAEALEALGAFLLDEEGDLGGALAALTRALVLGPSQVSIHASLARAYRRIGDQVKVRAHERVAEALLMFQERLKVRMGVGDDR